MGRALTRAKLLTSVLGPAPSRGTHGRRMDLSGVSPALASARRGTRAGGGARRTRLRLRQEAGELLGDHTVDLGRVRGGGAVARLRAVRTERRV